MAADITEPDTTAPAQQATGNGAQTAAAGAPADKGTAEDKPKGSGKAKRVLLVLGVAAIAFGAYEGMHWWTYGRFHTSSDDAYLQADVIALQTRDTGYISEILVADNATVAEGQVIARIDRGDYDLALKRAENTLASAQSAVARIGAQIAAAEAGVGQAEAALAAAKATDEGAQAAYDRARNLRASDTGSQATLDNAKAAALSAAANVQSAAAAIAAAKGQVAVLNAQREEAVLAVAAAETGVAQARRDLDFTEIRAPFAGVLTRREIEVGSFVAAGSRVGSLVPMSKIYVEANFKETQIAGIRPGARVSMSVDAWPDAELRGHVTSLTAGTGAVFSLLPPQNATGNFTKVVQRVPVRIEIEPEDRARLPLRPGMSVVVEVDTRTGQDEALPTPQPTTPAAATAPEAAVGAADFAPQGKEG